MFSRVARLAVCTLAIVASIPRARAQDGARNALPLDLSTYGLGSPVGPGSEMAAPSCPSTIQDGNGRGCLGASSIPELGKLYPMTQNLFVAPGSGFVGIGTLLPLHRLDVAGSARLGGSLVFGDDTHTIQFPATTAPNTPMIQMFSSGTLNDPRMVIGHSPAFSNWGLRYVDSFDQFVFQQSDATPVVTVDMQEKNLVVPDGILEVIQRGHQLQPVTLNVVFDGTADIRNEVVRIKRGAFSPSVANEDLVELELPNGSATNSQFLECEGSDVEFRVDANGRVFADGGFTGPADFAEMFRVTSGATSVEPGDVLEIDPTSSRGIRRSTRAYSRLVSGIYSTNPGFVGSEREWDEPVVRVEGLSDEAVVLERKDMAERYDEVPMAVVGVVPAKVSAENGPIVPGDLLVTSNTPGHAMRADRPEAGTIVGKALEPLLAGTGQIRVLVTLQ